MGCPKCNGSGWVWVEKNGRGGMLPCTCRTPPPSKKETKGELSLSQIIGHVDDLCDIYKTDSPFTDSARSAFARRVLAMVQNEEQLLYMFNRAVDYGKWPGISGLRMILCYRYTPKDGKVLSYNEDYPDGFPEQEVQPEPAPLPMLPPGTADKQLGSSLETAAGQMDLSFDPRKRPGMVVKPRKQQIQSGVHTPPVDAPVMERCRKCRGTGKLPDEDFCQCELGQELQKVERGVFSA